MRISTASAKPIGSLINDGNHKPFRAVACPIRALDYDESQVSEEDIIRRQLRSGLEYDC